MPHEQSHMSHSKPLPVEHGTHGMMEHLHAPVHEEVARVPHTEREEPVEAVEVARLHDVVSVHIDARRVLPEREGKHGEAERNEYDADDVHAYCFTTVGSFSVPISRHRYKCSTRP